MNKFFFIIILLLLCIHCNNPQISEIPGCTNINACNFDESANLNDDSCEFAEQNYDCDNNCIVNLDCAGKCAGVAVVDDCGVCGGAIFDSDNDGILDGNYDCDGNCIATGYNLDENGLDCAGECNGDAVVDCANECGGSAVVDDCGICNGSGVDENNCCTDGLGPEDEAKDCAGECGGNAVIDCNGECGGNTVIDDFGTCCFFYDIDECGLCNSDPLDDPYELVWQDEFEEDGLDLSKWNIEEWPSGAFNEEEQAYTDAIDNIYLEDGQLHIRALRETYDFDEDGVDDAMYTSGRITTKYKGDWEYVKVEIKAELPMGEGTWPAIWMLPTDNFYGTWPYSGEIDIMEYVGHDPGMIHSSVHNATYYENLYQEGMPQQQTSSFNVGDVSISHIYSVIWRKNKIIFYVDDEEIMVYNNLDTGFDLWPFDKNFYLILNLAIGGTWGGVVVPEIFPVEFIVDYVRVYQQPCY